MHHALNNGAEETLATEHNLWKWRWKTEERRRKKPRGARKDGNRGGEEKQEEQEMGLNEATSSLQL